MLKKEGKNSERESRGNQGLACKATMLHSKMRRPNPITAKETE